MIGTSAQGRDIAAYRTGEPGKPVVIVVATMHGEENFGQYVARGLLQGRPVTGVDLWVVPVLNPDGLTKDRRWLDGGVDLNRTADPARQLGPAGDLGPRDEGGHEVPRRQEPAVPRLLAPAADGVDTSKVKDNALMRRLAAGLRLPTKSLNCRGSCHGTMTGWFNAHHAGSAITVEYGATARSMARMRGRDADAVLAAVGGAQARG